MRKLCLPLLLLTLFLAGCNMRTVDQLYCLPKRSETYMNLQAVIDSAMSGREYSAPTDGDNQQTLQAADLDGDGQQEYLLFAKDSSETPLQILIFAADEDSYRLVDVISTVGTSFNRVDYVQMDGLPGVELVVSHQVSDQVLRSVSVYTLEEGSAQLLLNVNCSRFVCLDLDRDGNSELVTFRPGDGEQEPDYAEYCRLSDGAVERSAPVALSGPVDQIQRIVTASLSSGAPAIYVDSASGTGALHTDVLAMYNNAFCNVTAAAGIETQRSALVYAEDIDSDGVLEIPELLTDAEPYIIRWFAMRADGTQVDKLYSCHHLDGGWYLVLDAKIAGSMTVIRQGNSYDFGIWDAELEESQKLFTVFVLTGQKREEQAAVNNRFVLYRSEATIYAADLEAAAAAYGITKESLIGSFQLIRQDWITGES